MNHAVQLRVLGPPEVPRASRPCTIGSPLQRRLLTALTIGAGTTLSTEHLSDRSLGDDPPPAARNSLKSHIARLRALIGDRTILTRPPGYALDMTIDAIDAIDFERSVTEARAEVARTSPGPMPCGWRTYGSMRASGSGAGAPSADGGTVLATSNLEETTAATNASSRSGKPPERPHPDQALDRRLLLVHALFVRPFDRSLRQRRKRAPHEVAGPPSLDVPAITGRGTDPEPTAAADMRTAPS